MTKSALADATDILLPTIREVLKQPSVPVDNADANQVAAAVTKEVAPMIVNATNSEPWYQSRVTWGAILSIASAGLAVFGITIDEGTRAELVTLILAAIPVIGGAITLWGRWIAKKPIGTK